MSNQEITERITGTCSPSRANTLTGANQNYSYKAAEYQPPFDGYESQLVPTGVAVNWPTRGRSLPFEAVLEGVLGGNECVNA